MNKERYKGYLQLALAMSLGGSSVIMGKLVSHLPIFLAQTISMGFALAVILPLAILKEGKPRLKNISRKDYLFMALQGFFGVLMFRVFMMVALKYASAASTGIVLSMTPAVLALFSVLFLKEKIGIKTIIAVFLCFSGMSMLNVDFKSLSLNFDRNFILGNIFAFLSVCSEALFTISRKKQSSSDTPLTSTAIVMFFALLMFIPIGGITAATSNILSELELMDFVYLLIYGALCSAAAYAFWFSGLAKVNISEAAGFSGFMPLSSVILSIIILGEKLKSGHIIGMALVLAGIYLIVLKRKKKDSHVYIKDDLVN